MNRPLVKERLVLLVAVKKKALLFMEAMLFYFDDRMTPSV
jgi:hypothetical protein